MMSSGEGLRSLLQSVRIGRKLKAVEWKESMQLGGLGKQGNKSVDFVHWMLEWTLGLRLPLYMSMGKRTSQGLSGWEKLWQGCSPTSCSQLDQLWDGTKLFWAWSCHVLKTFKSGDSTASLSPFLCLSVLSGGIKLLLCAVWTSLVSIYVCYPLSSHHAVLWKAWLRLWFANSLWHLLI